MRRADFGYCGEVCGEVIRERSQSAMRAFTQSEHIHLRINTHVLEKGKNEGEKEEEAEDKK
jgi:hypothetical protein